MKTIKMALLGGAALAVMTAGAQADDLAALKAEIEALNSRVAQLETAPAVPAGYSLMSVSEADAYVVPGNANTKEMARYGEKANVIGVLPTADAPAAASIEWSGYVYAIVAHTDYSYYGGDNDTNVLGRANLRVVGRTDTAVGEVGVRVQLRSQWSGVDGDVAFHGHEYWGWWAMTPELTFGGGYSGSLGNIGHGMDGTCNCWWTDWFSNEFRAISSVFNVSSLNALNPGDATQVRLSYASGPLSMAVALEESDPVGTAFGAGDLAVAGEVAYSGDTFSAEISGIWYDADNLGFNSDGWQIGAGASFALGDMASISLAGGIGEHWTNGDYYSVSGLVNFGLSDNISFEIGAAYGEYTDFNVDLFTVQAGLYYNPVSQLTLGLEGQWSDSNIFGDDFTTVDFVTIWRF